MPPIHLDIQNGVGTVSFNRPENGNALDLETAQLFLDSIRKVEADPRVSVLVLRGEGSGFCAGGDLRAVGTHLDGIAPLIHQSLELLNEAVATIQRLDAIAVASVHGFAAGAGFSIALMCDICIAAEGTRFRPAYARLGVTPDAGGSIGAARTLGSRRALALMLLEDEISVERMAELGLVDRIAPREQFAQATDEVVRRLASIPKEVLGQSKRLIHASARTPLEQQLDNERDALVNLVGTSAFRSALYQVLSQ